MVSAFQTDGIIATLRAEEGVEEAKFNSGILISERDIVNMNRASFQKLPVYNFFNVALKKAQLQEALYGKH